MPLIKSKSKQAFEHNTKAEIGAGKPVKQALAIAYDIKRRAPKPKKMAEGGKTDLDRAMHPIDTIKNAFTDDKKPNMDTRRPSPPKPQNLNPDQSATSKPREFAEGGKVKNDTLEIVMNKPKMMPKSNPRMVNSSVIRPKRLDAYGNVTKEEHELEDSLPPESDKDQPPEFMNEKDPDRFGPENENLHMKKMADGGIAEDSAHDDEEMDDHHTSIAAAIMAKRKRMAEGGVAMENNEEQPNAYYSADKAALKENYDDTMMHKHTPMDSDEDSPGLSDEDAHDMVSSIRRKMKSMR